MSKRWQFLLGCALAVAAACSTGSAGPPYKVSSDVVRGDRTQQVQVWAPVGNGSWPVVYAVPGVSGHKSDFDLLGPALARRGVVVFATDYRMTHTTLTKVVSDMACGYRLARRVATGYGGDLNRPVTAVGYSFGATWMLAAVLQRPAGGDGRAAVCGQRLPLPDVVVGVSGCYYTEKEPPGFTVTDLNRRQARVALVAGSADRSCPAWQSKKAAATLGAAGFHTTLTTIRGANHYTPVFHDVVGGKWVSAADHAAGERTVRAILAAIDATS